MVLEMAVLTIKEGQTHAFEQAFQKAECIISRQKGYVSHSIQQCIKNDHSYVLLVYWTQLKDHTIGFRESADYLTWKSLLHHFYDPFPEVNHYMELTA
jgi:heme-degrading monooxygenase HmoA